MEAKSVEDRVALLENEMQALRCLPDRVTSLESQMVQFRAEVRAEFSATRKELREEFREALKSEVSRPNCPNQPRLIPTVEVIGQSLLKCPEIHLMHRAGS